jgi:DNA-binding CsgD family transcriptional regulator
LHIALSRLAQRRQEASAVPAGESLSPREREILGWMCLGKSNIEIATILGISFWTVKIHVRNLMKKLMVCNRSQAVARAITLGIIPARSRLPEPEVSEIA